MRCFSNGHFLAGRGRPVRCVASLSQPRTPCPCFVASHLAVPRKAGDAAQTTGGWPGKMPGVLPVAAGNAVRRHARPPYQGSAAGEGRNGVSAKPVRSTTGRRRTTFDSKVHYLTGAYRESTVTAVSPVPDLPK